MTDKTPWAIERRQPQCPYCYLPSEPTDAVVSTRRRLMTCEGCGQEFYARFWAAQEDEPRHYDD